MLLLTALIMDGVAEEVVSSNTSCLGISSKCAVGNEVAATLQVKRRCAAMVPGIALDQDEWEPFNFIAGIRRVAPWL